MHRNTFRNKFFLLLLPIIDGGCIWRRVRCNRINKARHRGSGTNYISPREYPLDPITHRQNFGPAQHGRSGKPSSAVQFPPTAITGGTPQHHLGLPHRPAPRQQPRHQVARTATTITTFRRRGSDSNPGTHAAPWETINHADASITLGAGGTIVHVACGTYIQSPALTRNGAANQMKRLAVAVQRNQSYPRTLQACRFTFSHSSEPRKPKLRTNNFL